MYRPKFVGVRLREDELEGLELYANSEGLEKSSAIRQLLRQKLREIANTGILSDDLLASLKIQKQIDGDV